MGMGILAIMVKKLLMPKFEWQHAKVKEVVAKSANMT